MASNKPAPAHSERWLDFRHYQLSQHPVHAGQFSRHACWANAATKYPRPRIRRALKHSQTCDSSTAGQSWLSSPASHSQAYSSRKAEMQVFASIPRLRFANKKDHRFLDLLLFHHCRDSCREANRYHLPGSWVSRLDVRSRQRTIRCNKLQGCWHWFLSFRTH